MPNAPKLEECELEEDILRRHAAQAGLADELRELYLTFAAVRRGLRVLVTRGFSFSSGTRPGSHCNQAGFVGKG